MTSKMFQADYRRMTAEGVKFEPEDVIRLNALALKVKLAARPFAALHLPRVVFLEGLGGRGFTLREPSIGHELWLERVGEYLDYHARHNFRVAYCYALSREHTELPDPMKPRRVLRKMFGWATRYVLPLTSETVSDALDFVLFGADWTTGEFPPEKPGAEGAGDAAPGGKTSPCIGALVAGVARRLPLTLDDAKRMTAAEFYAALRGARAADGGFDGSAERKDALGDYFRARDEIRARSSAGKGGSA
jgi:hypothetical protein